MRTKEDIREWHRQRYQAHKVEISEYNKQYRLSHGDSVRSYEKKCYARLKPEILTHYGNGKLACVRCGYAESIHALSIDHINGNGAEHRRAIGLMGGTHLYWWLKKNNLPEGYQTLCMNCQWIKRFEKNEYGNKIEGGQHGC